MSLFQKAHYLVDLAAGLAVGSYRSGLSTKRPDVAPSDEGQYALNPKAIAARIDAASNAPLPASHYPKIYWAKEFLRQSQVPHICDFGGGYGEDYFRFRRFLSDIRFTVVETPTVVGIARSVEILRSVTFTERMPETCDVFYTNGTAMNAYDPLMNAIETAKPPHLILSAVECTDDPTFYTIQNTRKSRRKWPYITLNRAAFISTVEELGYQLIDQWTMGKAGSGVFLGRIEQPDYYGFAFSRR